MGVGLDVYFRQDVANILRATACASEGAAGLAVELASDSELRAKLEEAGISAEQLSSELLLNVYRQGVRNALIAVGLAFGLEPVGPGVQVRTKEGEPLAGLLWAEAPGD
jgi:hypothetical protein